ncbi:hypothetical protein AB0M02_02130 [Actinoplanes sp. NPDC051861]|uniref:hypothetical protein n=1 Tax=Actinoplanes sp. NPDC051861 TaxID=3155170 RepID=UPI003433F220
MRGEDGRGAGLWPSIPAIFRVMTGWFLTGIGVLNLAVELDGGLTPAYVVFHVVLLLAGMLLLTRHRLSPSRAGWLIAALLAAAGMGLGMLAGGGYPFPRRPVADLVFWCCAAVLLRTVIALVERRLPERRTPVDLSRYATPDRTGENVGGLT